MAQIPFKVSARTARLIGRENIATSKGAIIELVKNGYDADSPISIVYFDNKYSVLPAEISQVEVQDLVSKGIDRDQFLSIYENRNGLFFLKEKVDDDARLRFRKELSKLNCLYIIDAGEGMTQKIIRDHWMTIGTDNKSIDVFTKSGRVKAGAKGIGRFALDKLGNKAVMTTVFNPANHQEDTSDNGRATDFNGYYWTVNWEDFEGEFKTIDLVNAELNGFAGRSLREELLNNIPGIDLTHLDVDFKFGTILKISELRENWDDYFVAQVYSDLEVLVPPKESGGFAIYLFSSLEPGKYGEVLGSVCDDYDYKVTAVADENQNVSITVYRHEYDIELIPPELFEREAMKDFPYKKEDFQKGTWATNLSFAQLLPGFSQIDEDNVFNEIGIFTFSFYFLKRTYSTPDQERFFYKKFLSNSRKDWLDKFGGIKLFRDYFRVRPYGETNDVAFDWLALGNRKAQSPAGIAKKEGGWRVEPENIAGAINISRLTNVNFEDKSSREGLQENKTFQIFKSLIAAIINVFEVDRAHIAREMDAFDDDRFSEIRNRAEAEKIAKIIIEENRKKKLEKQKSPSANNQILSPDEEKKDTELILLAELNEKKDEEIEKLKEEQKVLRGLASSGIVLASFSHDLSKLNGVLSSRADKLKNLLLDKILEKDYLGIEDRKNPYVQLEKMKKQDLKLQNWLNFSMGAARKDKRKRKQLFLKKYFSDFKSDWSTILEGRAIEFDISNIVDLDLRIFEIDFDSIFNNLLVNSIDAFNLSKVNRERKITITTSNTTKEISIDYYDNGPGLSSDIDKPEKIFEPLYTTKRNAFTGEEEGTGLGMWIVRSIVLENDASAKLLFPSEGFGVRITFPLKFKPS